MYGTNGNGFTALINIKSNIFKAKNQITNTTEKCNKKKKTIKIRKKHKSKKNIKKVLDKRRRVADKEYSLTQTHRMRTIKM